MSSFLAAAQVDTLLRSVLTDKLEFRVDSSIIFAADTNKRTKADQPHGVWRERRGDNSLASITSYYNGRLHGHALVFFPNGKIATSNYNYLDTLDGPSLSFWPNGRPRSARTFKKGVLEGMIKVYDTTGNLSMIYAVRNGMKEGAEIQFSERGNIILITEHRSGLEDGIRREYDDTGGLNLIVEYEIKNGIKLSAKHYKNGLLIKTEKL